MMQAMRDKVKMIYWVVILSFVALSFLVWGIGLDGTSQPTGDAGVVAKVNGSEIYHNNWQERINSILASMRQQSGETPLTENQILRAREQAFDQLVEETLLRQEAERQGITVTNDEIVDVLANNPPDYLLNFFRDENGQVDLSAYHASLNDPAASASWRQVEESLRLTLPLDKLYQRVAGQAVVGEEEIRAEYEEQTARAVVEYVGALLDNAELGGATSVEPAAIEAYYQQHLSDYQQPERAHVRFVQLAKTPSEADEQEVLSIVQELRKEIADGQTSFADVARSYSEDASAESGGDLGWFDRERMVKEFTDAAFALGVGELSEPVRTEFGYHLIMVTNEKPAEKGNREEIQASHILIKVAPGAGQLADLHEAFDAFHAAAQSKGLESAATEAGYTVTDAAPFQRDFNIPGLPNSLAGSSFAFSAKPGDLSPVYESDEGYYCVELVEILPAGPRPLDEVRTLVEAAVLQERQTESAAQKLRAAWSEIAGGRPMAAVAKAHGLVHAVTDTFTLRQNIPDVGFATPFARAAISLTAGGQLPEVRTTRGVFGLRVLWRSSFDEARFRVQRAEIANRLRQDRQQKLIEQWLKQLRDSARIEDLRASLL